MNDDLENQFHEAMLNVYRRAKSECGYNATYFLKSVNEHGGIATAKSLLGKSQISDGFTELYERKRLDLSVECLVLRPNFRDLFAAHELNVARSRLRKCEFDPVKCEQ